jgi:hypothetical protein
MKKYNFYSIILMVADCYFIIKTIKLIYNYSQNKQIDEFDVYFYLVISLFSFISSFFKTLNK